MTFAESIRYRLACTVAKIPDPSLEFVRVEIPVSLYARTDPAHFTFPESETYFVEFAFPDSETYSVELLKADVYSPFDFALLEKPTIHGKRFRVNKAPLEPVPDVFGKLHRSTSPKNRRTPRENFDFWESLRPILEPPVAYNFGDTLDLLPQYEPYPYQWIGIKFLVDRESALLGDDMGTGKTVQSLIACRMLFQRGKVRKALIVTPLSVLTQWHRELEKWAPALRALVVRGTPEYRKQRWNEPAHVWLTTYDALRRDIDYLVDEGKQQFDLVLLDEVQKIKNRGSGISQAARKLVSSQYKWGLSGTPVENRIDDLVSIFSFLKPGLFRGSDVPAEYARDRIEPYFLRRKLEDVRNDLPAKKEIYVPLNLGDKQQKTYDQMERDRVLELHGQAKITAFKIVTLIGELKKICNRDPVTGESAKMKWLRDKLPGICERGDKVLVFTQYVQKLFGGRDWLVSKLREEFGALNYGGDPAARARTVQQFENNSENHVLVANPRTVLGVNSLVVANWGVHFDHWWNPAVTNQATARLRRPDQPKEVVVYHLWVENTVEEMILQKTKEKEELYAVVIDSLADDVAKNIGKEINREVYDDLLRKHGFTPPPREEAPQEHAQNSGRPFHESVPEMSPREFEELVAKLFSKMGYKTILTPQAHDGGVDVIASKHGGEKLAIQCKLQQSPVGRPVLQQLLGVVTADASYSSGLIVTNAEASGAASALAAQHGRLMIVTGKQLESLLRKHGLLPTA